MGNAEWTGVPLAAVLKRAGVKAGAVEVVLEGADNGAIAKEPVSPGEIHYTRSLPLAKALMPEVILAYSMNGEPLSHSHGFPLRAVGTWLVWNGLRKVAYTVLFLPTVMTSRCSRIWSGEAAPKAVRLLNSTGSDRSSFSILARA